MRPVPTRCACYTFLPLRVLHRSGFASGANNAVGQLGRLLAIAVLPAAVGLSDAVVGGAAFAAGHTQALRIAAAVAAAATVLAAATFRRGPILSDR